MRVLRSATDPSMVMQIHPGDVWIMDETVVGVVEESSDGFRVMPDDAAEMRKIAEDLAALERCMDIAD